MKRSAVLSDRKLGILRLSHRHYRDQRMTTHVALTARAFGCSSFAYTGEHDESLEQSLSRISKRWGGKFNVSYHESYSSYIKAWDGIVVHLSMFGEHHKTTISDINTHFPKEDILIIVGGPKVPPAVYELADFNTAIGFQPHSEIAATAVFLTDLLGSDVLYAEFPDSEVKLEPGTKAGRSKFRSNASS